MTDFSPSYARLVENAPIGVFQVIVDRDSIEDVPRNEQQCDWFKQTDQSATLSIRLPDTEILVGRRVNIAIREVLDNAAKHTGKAPTVSISAEADDEKGTLWISIKDDGSGTPEREIQTLRSGGETPLAHGSGIGLWSVHWMIDSLGGDVAVRSYEQEGTTVTLSVPIETTQAQETPWNEHT